MTFDVLTLLSFREYFREPCAEFFGVMLFIIFGTGVNCQVSLGGNTLVASSPHGVSISYFPKWVLEVMLSINFPP